MCLRLDVIKTCFLKNSARNTASEQCYPLGGTFKAHVSEPYHGRDVNGNRGTTEAMRGTVTSYESRDIVCVVVAIWKVTHQTSVLAIWNGPGPNVKTGPRDAELLAEDPDLVHYLSSELLHVTVCGKHNTRDLEHLIGKYALLEGVSLSSSATSDSCYMALNLSKQKCKITVLQEPPASLVRLLNARKNKNKEVQHGESVSVQTECVQESVPQATASERTVVLVAIDKNCDKVTDDATMVQESISDADMGIAEMKAPDKVSLVEQVITISSSSVHASGIPDVHTSSSPLILQVTEWGCPTLYESLPPVIVTHNVQHLKPIPIAQIKSREPPFECRLIASISDIFPNSWRPVSFIWATCKKCKKSISLSSLVGNGDPVHLRLPCPWCKYLKLSLRFLLVLRLTDPTGKMFVFAKCQEAVHLFAGLTPQDVCNAPSSGARLLSQMLSNLSQQRAFLDVMLSAYEERDDVVYYRIVRTLRCKPLLCS
ncbi:uncharacterized protein LOC135367431 [Ornithodoros turicata]|uniref:uncharacterized protein LOC135367431 n=1 Tax=Ornithodoros turicata TaxID=34597 RepID=UPI0031393527